ncbi:acyltransferase [Rheinheimera sp. UJ63]|uniref:acyltransferase n=1 Tax=Rheinheimera sp. UJ63 TaxID=2910157 RepID=UPI001F32CA3B|nr:acyltransferase [Rheinheimera sp. UJ63]MCF4007791.1 acyltransferase [Rheinheimera sp. UJ63]
MKTIFKKLIKLFFRLLASPFFIWLSLNTVLIGRDQAFQSMSQVLSVIPGILGIYLRAAFYHLACPNTSDEISIGFLSLLSHRDTVIEKGVYIGPQCNIGKCRIGADTMLGSGVHILSGNKQHNFENTLKPMQQQGGHYHQVNIGRDCWLGNSSVVMADVADHSIIAAASVVTKSIEETHSICAGNPAKFIKSRLNQQSKD